MWTRNNWNNWVVSRNLFRYLIDDGVDHHDLTIFMMALPFRTLWRLVGAASKPVTTGLNSEVARPFGTTALRLAQPRTKLENQTRSIYYVFWKRKWVWITILGAVGATIYDLCQPDRVERRDKLYKGWNHLTTNVYSPTMPQHGTKPEAKPEAKPRDWASLQWGSM